MDSYQVQADSRWYVVRTHLKQEVRAEGNLKLQSIETFAPKLKEARCNGFTREITYVRKSLFPRYVFARFDVYQSLHKVRFTRGVHSVVSLGDTPTAVGDEIIAAIRFRVAKDGFIKLGQRALSELRPGDEVKIKSGPLESFTGIFEREMKDSERVMVLLNTISYQAHIVIESQLLEKIV